MASTATTTATINNNIDNPSNPLFLHSSYNLGTILVYVSLTGDYPTWRHVMTMALYAKNKFGFVDGSLSRPLAEEPLRDA